jgi:small subunit ribosomal protein S35
LAFIYTYCEIFFQIHPEKFVKNERDPRARYNRMPVDQDWTNVWPTQSIFRQSAVPLPVRQGYVKNQSENGGLPPEKYANTELMKIPNFLHLTPSHIKKQCAAIKSKN